MVKYLRRAAAACDPLWAMCHRALAWQRPPAHVLHDNIHLQQRNAIYFCIPKVASSTLKKVCADDLGLAYDGANVAEAVHRLEFPSIRKDRVRAIGETAFKFAFVRNPWDRLLSCYRDKILNEAMIYGSEDNEFVRYMRRHNVYRPGMTFEDFVRAIAGIPDRYAEAHVRSQVWFLSDRRGLFSLDHVGRFETLVEDYAAVAERIGWTLPAPHIRQSVGARDYRDHYSLGLRRLVAERYQSDISRFRYTF